MANMIELYLVRHAIAAERGEAFPDDRLRPLTREGIARFKREVEGLDALRVTVEEVLTSPLTRTRQTADILAAALPGKPPVTEFPALAPEGSIAAVINGLGAFSRRKGLALVGHEPSIGELAARLIGARTPIPFKKGAICRIDVPVLPPSRSGQLVWFVTPRILRRLKG